MSEFDIFDLDLSESDLAEIFNVDLSDIEENFFEVLESLPAPW